MQRTSDGVEVPSLIIIANKIADAAGAIPGTEEAKRKAASVEVAFAIALLFERQPEYSQQMLVEFRWWTMKNRDYFNAATVEMFTSGSLLAMIDGIPDQLPVELPHGR